LKKKTAESGTLESNTRAGRSRMLSKDDYAKLKALNTKMRGDLMHAELAPKISKKIGSKVSAKTIFGASNGGGWRDIAKYTRPWLEDEHKKDRVRWTVKKSNEIQAGTDPWACTIDIDEKIFRCFTAKRKTTRSPVDQAAKSPDRIRVKSKTHIPQKMFLSAIAQPIRRKSLMGASGSTGARNRSRPSGIPRTALRVRWN
jgi:hypothetical protein